MFEFLKRFFKSKPKNPNSLKTLFANGLISKEEFLRFAIVQKGISLEKAETELKDFLAKSKKKKK